MRLTAVGPSPRGVLEVSACCVWVLQWCCCTPCAVQVVTAGRTAGRANGDKLTRSLQTCCICNGDCMMRSTDNLVLDYLLDRPRLLLSWS